MPRIPSYPLIGSLSNDDLLVIDDVSQQYATKSVELQSLKGYFNAGQATTTYVDDKVVSGAAFDTNTGVLTLTRTDGVDVTQGLDGRYALTTDVFSGSYNDLTNKPYLFSGSYNDLTNKPTIPTDNSQLANGEGYTDNLGIVQSLTTNSSSGAATLVDGVLNIPQYSSGGGGGFDGQFSSLTGVPTTISGYGIIDALQIGTTSNTALAGNTTTITTNQANAIAANSNKTSFPGFGTTAGTALEGDTPIPAAYTDADVDTHLNKTAQTQDNYVLSLSGNDYTWVAQSGGGAGVTQITAGDGISINPSGGTGNVTITAGTAQASTWQTYYRKFTGSELKNAFNGNDGDKITLVSVPAGKIAVLGIELTTFLNFSTGTTDYADNGRNLAIFPNTTSGFQYATSISMANIASIGSANPFGIKFKQVSTGYARAAEPGSDVVLGSQAQNVNITAGDRDFILTFAYRIIDLS